MECRPVEVAAEILGGEVAHGYGPGFADQNQRRQQRDDAAGLQGTRRILGEGEEHEGAPQQERRADAGGRQLGETFQTLVHEGTPTKTIGAECTRPVSSALRFAHDLRERQETRDREDQRRDQPDQQRGDRALLQAPDALVDGRGNAGEPQGKEPEHHARQVERDFLAAQEEGARGAGHVVQDGIEQRREIEPVRHRGDRHEREKQRAGGRRASMRGAFIG